MAVEGGVMSGRRNSFLWVTVSIGFLICFAAAAGPAHAARRFSRRRHAVHVARGPLYHGELLEDADSGRVLFERNGEMEWPPASMAKMMLVLVAEDQIKAGRFSLNDPVRVSERAAQTGGSRLGLREGQVYPLGELIKAAVIRSANDAAVAVAEKIGGSVEACVRMMNEQARKLGMTETLYRTVDGLPPRPGHDADITSARDLATVARALIYTTNILQWTSQETALFDDGEAVLHNTNHLIGHFEGCDGLKTGFTYQAGFNLTATAKRGDMRLIAVVLGAPSNPGRFRQAAHLMDWGFDNFCRVSVLRQGQTLPVQVQVEPGQLIQPIAGSDVKLVVPKTEVDDIRLQYSVPPTVSGPIASGEPVGQVIVLDGGEVLQKVNVLCPIPIREAPQLLNAGGAPASGARETTEPVSDHHQPQQEPR